MEVKGGKLGSSTIGPCLSARIHRWTGIASGAIPTNSAYCACAIDNQALQPPARSERTVRAPQGCGSGRTPGIEPLGHPISQHGRQVTLPKAPRHYLQPPPRPEALQGLLRHKLPGNDSGVCAGVFVWGRGVRGDIGLRQYVILPAIVMVKDSRFRGMADTTMIDRLKQFIESEMRSCSMDIGGYTPLYVYRMWGGAVAIEDIDSAMEEVRRVW